MKYVLPPLTRKQYEMVLFAIVNRSLEDTTYYQDQQEYNDLYVLLEQESIVVNNPTLPNL